MAYNTAIKKVGEVVEYIESSIHDKITLDSIASYGGLSKYHLHKVFKAITNKRLMDYVRNRKLSNSLDDLLYTDLKIVDIACNYNFDYEQSYIRSFINKFRISPNQYRKDKPALTITDKIDLNCLIPLRNDGFIVEPVIKVKPQFMTIGKSHKIYFADNLHFNTANNVGNDFFYNDRPGIKNAKFPDVYIGIIKYMPDYCDYKYYIPSVEVTDMDTIPEGLTGIKIPTRKYVVFKYIGFEHPKYATEVSLSELYNYIFKEWLPESNYEFSYDYHIEYIDESIAREDYCEIEIYVPVKDTKFTHGNKKYNETLYLSDSSIK